jgi:predicted dehydrogenase
VIGANSFVANAAVLPAIDAASNATLIATASLSGAVPERWAATDVDTYDDVLHHPAVEAIYIPLPNGLHREWTERAAAAGKHVLCEKPLAPNPTDAQYMADACATAGVLLAEAWMTPFDLRWSAMMQLAKTGLIGDVVRQSNQFTFTMQPEHADNYRWDPNQGGGALLDLGIYCIGTAVELWGTDCTIDNATQIRSASGVDASTVAELRWPGGRSAQIRCSFVEDETQRAEFVGSDGQLILEFAAFTSGHEFDHLITHSSTDPLPHQLTLEPGDPYLAMVEAFAGAVRGETNWPRPVQQSIELLELIERIRESAIQRGANV